LEAEEFEKERFLDVEQARGKLHLWIKEPRTARYINRVFRKFLFNFRDENQKKTYENKIIEMCNENRQSLEVSYVDLMHGAGSIAIWVSYEPNIILPYLNDIAFAVAC
jgi:DNA replication licensing factor MCM2